MNNQKQQVIDRIKQATNILVAVSANPSVDQLAAAIGLTLILNDVGKHATAVFSGAIPSTMEFLQPEKTLEKDTNSLRDFIIALDKSKADKLRYKVEDKVVKIFITPYRTSLSDKDLDFSQGDFNVDVVVCLGVHEQNELDQAITAHGRILHDAAVISINNKPGQALGSIDWQEASASSLSELVASLSGVFGKEVLDKQMATALLTGVVAETDRFRNEKTSPETMTVSAKLMTAGADQQLVASKLEQPPEPPVPPPATPQQGNGPNEPGNNGSNGATNAPPEPPKPDDGTLEIDHHSEEDQSQSTSSPSAILPAPEASSDPFQQIHIDEQGQLHQPQHENLVFTPQSRQLSMPDHPSPSSAATGESDSENSRHMMTEPMMMGGQLTANTEPEDYNGVNNLLAEPDGNHEPLLSREDSYRSTMPNAPAPSLPLAPDTPVATPAEPAPSLDLPPAATEPPVAAPQTYSMPLPPSDNAQPPAPVAPLPAINDVLSQPPAAPAMPEPVENYNNETLSEIEQSVHSPHVNDGNTDVSSARDAVNNAINAGGGELDPIAALNAQPLGPELHQAPAAAPDASSPTISSPATPLTRQNTTPTNEQAPLAGSPADTPLDMPMPPSLNLPPASTSSPFASSNPNPTGPPPPPVPPPMMPPSPGQ